MEDENKATKDNKNYLVPGSIVLAGVIIAAAVIYNGGGFRRSGGVVLPPSDAGNPNQAAAGNAAAAVAAEDGNDPYLGDPKAPVTMIEFSDFQCPFCDKFFREVEPKIIDKYVKTGKVRFVYRDFAFLGPESEYAAVAAECANEQGKFWQFHNYLFSNQQGENQGAFNKDKLKGFAKLLGLDTGKFNSCLDGDKYLSEVRKDTSDGKALGVNGTPGFIINGKLVVGALPFEQFDSEIQAALAAGKK